MFCCFLLLLVFYGRHLLSFRTWSFQAQRSFTQEVEVVYDFALLSRVRWLILVVYIGLVLVRAQLWCWFEFLPSLHPSTNCGTKAKSIAFMCQLNLLPHCQLLNQLPSHHHYHHPDEL
jgi:polyferredoxin